MISQPAEVSRRRIRIQPRPSAAAPGDPAPVVNFGRPIVRTFRRGGLIYGQGDTAGALYRLESGAVKLYALTAQGEAIAIAYIQPGQWFGEEALVGAATRTLWAEAVEPSRVEVIGRAQLVALAERPELLLALTRALLARLAEAEDRIEHLVAHKVPNRLAHALVHFARRAGQRTPGGVRLPTQLTHYAIAEYIGVPPHATVMRWFAA
jgi:CRP/FNR family cyclic AMP-dependent transcriptional regulator